MSDDAATDPSEPIFDVPRGRYFKRELARYLAFPVPAGSPVVAVLTSLQLFHFEGRPRARAVLTLELTLDAYQRAYEAGLFRLSLTSMAGADTVLELHDDAPVELELSPGPLPLERPDESLEAVADRLETALDEVGSVTLTWRRVMQREPDQDGSASVSSGVASIYLDDHEADADDAPVPYEEPPTIILPTSRRRVTRSET